MHHSLAPLPPFPRWIGYGLAALTGVLFYMSFPGLDLWPLAFIAWVPWMIGLRRTTPRQALLQGLIAGLLMGVLGFYWLLNMLQVFSGFGTALCTLFMLLLCAYQAGRYSLLGWLYVRAADRGWPAGLVFALAFAASETAYPLLFPFTFGATMHEVYPILQVAELGGPILVSLVVLAPNWAVASILDRWVRMRQAVMPGGLVEAFLTLEFKRWSWGLFVPLAAIIYGMIRIVQVDAAVARADKIKIGIVQANMSLVAKRQDRDEGLRRHTLLTKELVKRDQIELVVWPETSVTGVVPEEEAAAYYQKRVTGRLQVASIDGAVLSRPVQGMPFDHVIFNSALYANRKGVVSGRYDKHFLLAFGEYLPFGRMFPFLYQYSPNSSRFESGTSLEPLTHDGHDIATFICYEDIVPSFVNKLMHHGDPELLVNMTNDAWFGDSTEPWEHMALAKLRSVEHRRYMVRSTNSGVSGFVDPVGRLTQRTETFQEATISENVAWLKLFSPYRLWGEMPWWLASVVVLGMAFFRRPLRSTPAGPLSSRAQL